MGFIRKVDMYGVVRQGKRSVLSSGEIAKVFQRRRNKVEPQKGNKLLKFPSGGFLEVPSNAKVVFFGTFQVARQNVPFAKKDGFFRELRGKNVKVTGTRLQKIK